MSAPGAPGPSRAPPIRVFLVDDQALVRAGFRMVLDSQPDLTVVGEAGDGGEAVRALATVEADVVLMDVRMPGMDGLEATRRLLGAGARAHRPGGRGLKVVVLTTFDLDEHALPALQAGASGFLLKSSRPEDLIEAVRTVHRGDAVIAPSTTRRLLEHLVPATVSQRGRELHALVQQLTGREREVLLLMARGMSNAEVARELFVSTTTVKTHVASILAKLGARDRVQAVITAHEAGVAGTGAPGP